MKTLLNGLNPLSFRTKVYIATAIAFLLLLVACILLYRSNQNAKNELKIDKVEKAKEVTKEEVKQWNDKIDSHNNEFIETQKDLVKEAKEIRKNTKPNKLPNYEKPVIHSRSYNDMLDTLLIAQPN